jgi:hypothetical protein
MSQLSKQELTGLDDVVAQRKSLSDQLNNVTNMQANYITGQAGLLHCDDLDELTGGEGLTLDELRKIREHSYR